VPVVRVDVLNVATAPLRVPVPRKVVPSMKVIDPVGVGPPVDGGAGVTVAVKVTVWPRPAGFGDAVSAVVVLACWTVTVMPAEVLGENCVLPWYCAVTVLTPNGSAVVTSEATPPLSVPVPSDVVPVKN